MRRRRYLAAVGAVGLAGCLGGDDGDDGGDDPGTTTSPTTTTPDPATTFRRVSVAASDDLEPDLETTLAVEMVRPLVTADHTAVLRVTLTNDAGYDRSYVTTAREVFFGPISEGDVPVLALLESSDGTDPNDQRVSEDCWRLEDGLSYNTVEASVVLGPGESASVDLAVWGHHKNQSEECLPPGTYRFETDYDALPVDRDEKPPAFSWGFELAVSEP